MILNLSDEINTEVLKLNKLIYPAIESFVKRTGLVPEIEIVIEQEKSQCGVIEKCFVKIRSFRRL